MAGSHLEGCSVKVSPGQSNILRFLDSPARQVLFTWFSTLGGLVGNIFYLSRLLLSKLPPHQESLIPIVTLHSNDILEPLVFTDPFLIKLAKRKL
jgi:hypothetical protein